MSDFRSIPPLRDLSVDQFNIRLSHLMTEITEASLPSRYRRKLRFTSFRLKLAAIVIPAMALAAVAAVVVLVDVSGSSGVRPTAGGANAEFLGKPIPKPPATMAASIMSEWRDALRSGVAADPSATFQNPPPGALNQQLDQLSRQHHFDVVAVNVLHPLGNAPSVVVQTNDPAGLAASVSDILSKIDPKADTGDDRTGWAYEGFLFEALDGDGVPFLIVYNFWRGPHSGGGEWASAPNLYPAAHG